MKGLKAVTNYIGAGGRSAKVAPPLRTVLVLGHTEVASCWQVQLHYLVLLATVEAG